MSDGSRPFNNDPAQPTEVWLVRHGETEWSRDHRHTSFTELPLTDVGAATARELRSRLEGIGFAQVLCSPRQRARATAELTGFADVELTDDLAEWNYGDYEGITTATIRQTVPGWSVWSHPAPGGESAEQVGERIDRLVQRCRATPGKSLLFAHGHSLRVFAARWLGLPVSDGRLFRLDTATVSRLGFERENPVILSWNA